VERVTVDDSVRRLVDDYRCSCLWFLRQDYYPTTSTGREQVFRLIEQHGDLQAFRRVTELRTWLSHHSSGTSVPS
jgi:hypothetical protein